MDAVPLDGEINWEKTPQCSYVWIEQTSGYAAPSAVNSKGQILFIEKNGMHPNESISLDNVLWDSASQSWLTLPDSGLSQGISPKASQLVGLDDQGHVFGISVLFDDLQPSSPSVNIAGMVWKPNTSSTTKYDTPSYFMPAASWPQDSQQMGINLIGGVSDGGVCNATTVGWDSPNSTSAWEVYDGNSGSPNTTFLSSLSNESHMPGAILDATTSLMFNRTDGTNTPWRLSMSGDGDISGISDLFTLASTYSSSPPKSDISRTPATAGASEERVWFSVNHKGRDEVFIEKRVGGSGVSRWYNLSKANGNVLPSMNEGALRLGQDGTAITEDKVWRNGKYIPINDLVSKPNGSDLEVTGLIDLASNGIILASATQAGSTKTGLLVPVEVVPDWNRDGKIDSADRGKITEEKPWRFWVNDDDDSAQVGGSDIPGEGSNGKDSQINGIRDLVDWFPLFLDIKELLKLFPSSEYDYVLENSDNALSIVETTLSPENAGDYLKAELGEPGQRDNPNGIVVQANLDIGPIRYFKRVDAQDAKLSAGFLSGAEDGTGGVLILEASKPTSEPLELIVRKKTGDSTDLKVLFPLSISPVEAMFRHLDLTQIPKDYDGGSPGAAASPLGTRIADPGTAYPDELTNGKYFVFLHGFNVPVQRARGWNAELFKRMHQMGSKARFVGVTWTGATGIPIAGTPSNIGNAASSTDYHKAVFFAMQTGAELNAALAFTGEAEVTIAAHSLGNMVVGEAVENGGFLPTRYYIINGAVARQAYDAQVTEATEKTAMTEGGMKLYAQRLHAVNWHNLFPQEDNRNKLTWKDRFAKVQRTVVTYNFYSPGDDVVQNPTSDTALGGIWAEGLARGAWTNQEFMKGTELATFVQSRAQGGWGFNFDPNQFEEFRGYYKSEDGIHLRKYLLDETSASIPGGITNEQLKTKPFFKPFKEFDLFSPTLGSAKAEDPKVHRDILAAGIPASSYAVATNTVPSLTGNHNMEQLMMTNPSFWPTEGHQDESVGHWLHSDFRNVALSHVYKMYAKMIELGELNQN